MEIRRREIFLANLEPVIGSEQGRIRPVLIVQNDIGNKSSPITIIAPITTKTFSIEYPTNVEINAEDSGLKFDSTILLNQIRAIDKQRLVKKIGEIDLIIMRKVELAIKISLDLQ